MEELQNVPETGEKKSGNFLTVGGLLIIALVGLFVIFNGKKKTAGTMAVAEATVTPIVESAATSPVEVVNGTIAIEAGSFYYKPNLIRVKKGEKVKLTLNSVSMMHDFNIDELGIKVPVTKSGGSSSVEFVANKVGEFEFYCSVGNHRAMGQVGKLIVTE